MDNALNYNKPYFLNLLLLISNLNFKILFNRHLEEKQMTNVQ